MTENPIADPTTCRLRIALLSDAPDATGDRLYLREWHDHGHAENELCICLGTFDAMNDAERLRKRVAGRLGPLGTWPRYRQEVATAKALIAHLGWTLTDDEERLMKALELIALASQAA